MFRKVTTRLKECCGKYDEDCFALSANGFTHQIRNRPIEQSATDNGYRKDEQWNTKFIQQDQCIAPGGFPLPQCFFHSREYPSMGRRTDIRRTVSPTRDVTFTTSTLISSAGRF